MKKLILLIGLILFYLSSFSQKKTEWVISDRFIGHKDSCSTEIVWAPGLEDGNHRLWIFDSKIIIEERWKENRKIELIEGIENWSNDKEERVSFWAESGERKLKCIVTKYFNKEFNYLHVYVMYDDWVFGYNLTGVKSVRQK